MPNPLKILPASVDIGSNSTILLIADFEKDDSGKEILLPKIQKVEICRLGEDIYNAQKISKARLEELSRILSSFRSTAHALGAEIKACAMTEAARKAENGEELMAAVEKALWIKPRIISGEEEAAYTFRAVEEWHGKDIVTVDIGGGSTEVSDGKKAVSVPIGSLFLFKKMGKGSSQGQPSATLCQKAHLSCRRNGDRSRHGIFESARIQLQGNRRAGNESGRFGKSHHQNFQRFQRTPGKYARTGKRAQRRDYLRAFLAQEPALPTARRKFSNQHCGTSLWASISRKTRAKSRNLNAHQQISLFMRSRQPPGFR